MDTAIKKPRIVAFEITRRCKLNCLHCRAYASDRCTDDLTTDQCRRIIKSIADYNRCVLIFTGGEPFERPDLFELIDFAVSAGLVVSIATCGYEFDIDKAQLLKKSGVITLSFSLDSDNPGEHDNFRNTKGAFEKTLTAIEVAKKAGLKFQINTTVSRLNFKKIPDIAYLAEKLGAYCFNPFMLVPAGRAENLSDISLSPEEYEEVLRIVARLKNECSIEIRFTCAPRFAVVFKELYPHSKKKVFGCLAAGDFAFVSHTGDVQTCGFLKIPAGNLLETDNFRLIWEKSELFNSIRRKKFTGKCKNCNYLDICGGCRARAFAHTGDYLASDPLCPYINIASTLVAAHIEESKIDTVAAAINSLSNVSHNYLRKHYYNLWFTLKPVNGSSAESIIRDLSQKFGITFLFFPAVRRYKLDSSAVKRHNPPHNFNALFCCAADEKILQSAAQFLASLPQISHCFERKTTTSWQYNLYAMIHSQSPENIEKMASEFVTRFGIRQFQLLPTIRSLKD